MSTVFQHSVNIWSVDAFIWMGKQYKKKSSANLNIKPARLLRPPLKAPGGIARGSPGIRLRRIKAEIYLGASPAEPKHHTRSRASRLDAVLFVCQLQDTVSIYSMLSTFLHFALSVLLDNIYFFTINQNANATFNLYDW